MKLQRLLMVEPRSPGKHIYSRFHLPRLGLPILAALARQRGLEVRICIEEISPLRQADLLGADMVCISSITPTARSAYLLADRARRAGLPVLMGGAHPSFMPEEALGHADWVLRGEAERSFPALLDCLRADADLRAVPGLSWRGAADEPIHNPADPRPIDMDAEVPAPDFDSIIGRRPFHRGIIPIQISRGCPHCCRFCSVVPIFGQKMRYASREKVADELERSRGKGDMVFFYDDNLCGSPGRAKDLLDYLMRREIFLPPWLAQVSVRTARDRELLALMQRSGCYAVFVGFESISEGALDLYRKRQAVDDIRMATHRFHEHGIRVHGMFMTGSDAEDVETIRRTADFALDNQIDTVQFLVLTPLPGTALFEEMESAGRLLTRDWSLYDTHHAVFRPARMSAYALMDETFKAMARVYSARRMLGLLSRADLRQLAIYLYARIQIQRWRWENRHLMTFERRVERRFLSGLADSVSSR